MASEATISKVGPKGQVVIPKRLREKYSIRPGKQVEQVELEAGVLIRPATLVKDWQNISKMVDKKWPKKVSAVQAVREERERRSK